MKRILFLMVSCVMLFAQCEHPYEEELLGSFPFAELMDSNPGIFESGAAECDLRVSTNMTITTRVKYVVGGSKDWIHVESAEEKGGIVRLRLKIDENIRRENRKAELTVLADVKSIVEVVEINQKAYSVYDKNNVYEGNLVLETQDDVDNCIYSKVNGNLVIGSAETDIKDLSPLVITSVTGNVRVVGCRELKNMGPLGSLAVSSVEFDDVNPVLVQTWKGAVREVTVRSVEGGMVNLGSFKNTEKLTLSGNACGFEGYAGLNKLKTAVMSSNTFTDTEGMEKMTSLETLSLNDNPLVNVNSLAEMTWVRKIDLSRTELSQTQIRYLEEMLTDETEIICDELSGKGELDVTPVMVKYFSAKFETVYRWIDISSSPNSYMCVFNKSGVFSMGAPLSLNTSPNPLEFDIKNLEDNTMYYLWLCAIDDNGGIHISESLPFATPEIVFDHKGDLILETQDDVDECVSVTVSGNLILGKESSDISDLSKLTVTEVGGGVVIKGCHLLNDFGPVSDYKAIKYLELNDVSSSLPSQWTGSVKDLRVRNISTGTVNLSDFSALTALTLQNNACGFAGMNVLTNVTDAVLSDNQFTSTDELADMTSLRNLDLSGNPLIKVNSLKDMTNLKSVDLSETRVSETQVRYLKNVMPETVVFVYDNIKGTAALSIQDTLVKYRSAELAVEYTGLPSSYNSGYIVSKTSKFPSEEALDYDFSSIPGSFVITGLDDDTEYHVWFYVLDNMGGIHLSEPDTFKTKKVVENYVGDLVLKTQEDVDECVHTSVTGNLTIGCPGSDIHDLSSLTIKSVSGTLTVTGCLNLSDFGGISKLDVSHVILDNTSQSITNTWSGTADALTIRNITKSATCSLFCFDEIRSLTLSDNKCSFSYMDQLVNVTSAELPRNKFGTIEFMASWTKLKTLNLSGNPLYNINELAQLTNLTSLDISNTSLSQTQVRYVTESLPSTVSIKSSGITGSGSLSVTNTGVNYFSASFSASISGISSDAGGYYINDDSSFPGESGRVEKVDIYGDALTVFDAKTLEDGTTYSLWYYVEDTYGSVHISERISFTTNKVNYYSLTVTPSWPSFENDASAQSDFGSIRSNMLVYKESVVAGREDSMMSSGNAYSVELPEGMTAMGLFAVEGVAEGNNYDGYSWSSNMNMSSPVWTLTLDSETGSSSDIAVGYLSHDLQEDASLEVSFKRPVAKVSMSVDFSGSIGSLDKVDEISIRMKYHYTKCQFGNASAMSYSTQKDLVFTASDVVVPADKKVKVADERYVFPLNTYYSPSVSITITFKDGTSKTVTPDVNTTINANKVYDFTFVTALTDSNGSFTVDVIERVEDNIEF